MNKYIILYILYLRVLLQISRWINIFMCILLKCYVRVPTGTVNMYQFYKISGQIEIQTN